MARGGCVPTLNAFDIGDTRAVVLIVEETDEPAAVLLRMRLGKEGGGKGALLSHERSLTLATNNDQTLFVFPIHDQATRYGKESGGRGKGNGLGIGKEGQPMNTLTSNENHAIGIAPATVRRLTPVECERLQGFPDDWTDGQADSHRYKQMGNAVTVNVAEVVGRFIMAAENA